MQEEELRELIHRVQQGQGEACRNLLDYIRPILAAFIRRQHCQPADLQDILQETCINLYRALVAHKYRHINQVAFLQWVKKIAWHKILYHRSFQRGPVGLAPGGEVDEAGGALWPDVRPGAAQQVEFMDLNQFLEQQLDEILMAREDTDEKKDWGLLKKMAFLGFYVDRLSQRELVELLTHYAHKLGLKAKITQATVNNWVSRGDILNALVRHLVEEHREVLERLPWNRLCPDLTEQEERALARTWGTPAGEAGGEAPDLEQQEAYERAREKVSQAWFLRIKEQLHLLRHGRRS